MSPDHSLHSDIRQWPYTNMHPCKNSFVYMPISCSGKLSTKTMFFGECSFVIETGTRLSSSIFQSRPSGDGRFCIATRRLIPSVRLEGCLFNVMRQPFERRKKFFTFLLFWQKIKYHTSSALVNRPPRLCKEQMKAPLEINDSLLTAGSALKWEIWCWSWLSLTRIFKAVVFPFPCKARVESQPVRAWKAGRALQRDWPREECNWGTEMNFSPSFTSVWDHNSWHCRSSKWVPVCKLTQRRLF